MDEQLLNVADRVPATRAEGPGLRYAIWLQGCPMRCPGCCNPEMLEFRDANWRKVSQLFEAIVETPDIEGVTFLGGEPFSQARALSALARRVRAAGLSVMIFSGFTLTYLRESNENDWLELLGETDLLVDGPFIQEQYVANRRWIGSANQEIHYLTDRYRNLSESESGWDDGRNTIEIRLHDGEIQINGFPHQEIRSFERDR